MAFLESKTYKIKILNLPLNLVTLNKLVNILLKLHKKKRPVLKIGSVLCTFPCILPAYIDIVTEN